MNEEIKAEEIREEAVEAAALVAAAEGADVSDIPAPRKKRRFRLHKRYKFLFGIAAVIAAVELVVIFATPYIDAAVPYQVSVDDRAVCYLKNKVAARDSLILAAKSYAEADETVRSLSSEGRLSINRANVFKAVSHTVTPQKASEKIITLTSEASDHPLVLSVAASSTEEEKFTPDPILRKDKNMLAGEIRTQRKSKKGLRSVTTTEVLIGEDVENAKITRIKVLKKGRRAIIYKGILGLPDGENWETYDGDPVADDGDAIGTTGTQYIGTPYKWGGRNLATGVSCLGFVRAIYAKYGISLPMSHPGMKSSGVSISYSNAQKGDIICYKSHVGIYLGNGKMVDATSHGGVAIRGVNSHKVVTVRRIIKKK